MEKQEIKTEEGRQGFTIWEASLRMAAICTIPFFHPSEKLRTRQTKILQEDIRKIIAL